MCLKMGYSRSCGSQIVGNKCDKRPNLGVAYFSANPTIHCDTSCTSISFCWHNISSTIALRSSYLTVGNPTVEAALTEDLASAVDMF